MAQVPGTALRYYHNTGSYASPSYTAIEGATTVSMDLSTTEHETTNKDSSNWYEFLPGYRSGTLSCTMNYNDEGTAGAQIVTDWLNRTLTKVEVKTLDTYKYSGDGYVTSCNVSAPHDGIVTVNFTFKFTGAITQAAA